MKSVGVFLIYSPIYHSKRNINTWIDKLFLPQIILTARRIKLMDQKKRPSHLTVSFFINDIL